MAKDDPPQKPRSAASDAAPPGAPRRITLAQLDEAAAREARRRPTLDEQLLAFGIAREEVERFLHQRYGGPYGGWSCDLSMTPVDPAALAAAPRELCARHRVLPIARAERALIAVVSDSGDGAAIEALRAAVGVDVMWGVASAELIDAALRAWEAGEPVGPAR